MSAKKRLRDMVTHKNIADKATNFESAQSYIRVLLWEFIDITYNIVHNLKYRQYYIARCRYGKPSVPFLKWEYKECKMK